MLYILITVLAIHCPAYAYADPGSGAMIWQLLMASSIGILFYARNFFSKVRTWLNGRD